MKRILNWFRPNKPDTPKFLSIFREFLDKQALENSLSPDTTRKHDSIYHNVCLYLIHKNMKNCAISEIKIPHMEDLRLWLHSSLSTCTASHSSRHIEMCKRVLRYSTIMGYIDFSPIETVKGKRDAAKEVIHLERNELDKMIKRTFASDMYNIVTDLYLFQCFTGLSYGDLWSWEIVQDGRHKFITSKRMKTGRSFAAEYTPQAEVILRRYEGQLPKITNQTYNRVLKEIASLLNIHKKLTTHTARKTFATIKNSEGFTLETIADMMGNTPDVARKHYIKGSRERTKNEIDRIHGLTPALN